RPPSSSRRRRTAGCTWPPTASSPPRTRSPPSATPPTSCGRGGAGWGGGGGAGGAPGGGRGGASRGANRPAGAGRGGGRLLALEVAEQDRRGCEVVVLSACETGLGRAEAGEGVLGLQRAFQVAGARTGVASLWKVPDRATQALMERCYDNLWSKKMGKL